MLFAACSGRPSPCPREWTLPRTHPHSSCILQPAAVRVRDRGSHRFGSLEKSTGANLVGRTGDRGSVYPCWSDAHAPPLRAPDRTRDQAAAATRTAALTPCSATRITARMVRAVQPGSQFGQFEFEIDDPIGSHRDDLANITVVVAHTGWSADLRRLNARCMSARCRFNTVPSRP